MPRETELPVRDFVELNQGFLELAAGGPRPGLPAAVLERLTRLDRKSRHRLAAVSFALFGFGFEDEADWARLLSPGVRDLEQPYDPGEPAAERFALVALTALRALVRNTPHSVSAWIGLPAATRARLADLEIGLLAPVAVQAGARLHGRRALREGHWHRLLDAAERGDARQLVLLSALGKQWTIRRSLGIEPPRPPPRRYLR